MLRGSDLITDAHGLLLREMTDMIESENAFAQERPEHQQPKTAGTMGLARKAFLRCIHEKLSIGIYGSIIK